MRRLIGASVLAATALLTACRSEATKRTDENYCAAVSSHLAELNNPSISTPADIARTVDLYRSIAKVAPLAVEQEWDVLTLAYETAATVVPNDQASMQTAADTIRASQKSATAIAEYSQRLCGTQIGAPIVPTTLLSGTTTTVRGATTTGD